RRSLTPEYDRRQRRYSISESDNDREIKSDKKKLIENDEYSDTESEGDCKGLCGYTDNHFSNFGNIILKNYLSFQPSSNRLYPRLRLHSLTLFKDNINIEYYFPF
ncbi:hypothetical protein BpHYR1_048265, partial [Brachionus plicatilis]